MATQAVPHGRVSRAGGWLGGAFAPALAHPRAFLAMNLLYLGSFLFGAAYGLVSPEARAELDRLVGEGFSAVGAFGPFPTAY